MGGDLFAKKETSLKSCAFSEQRNNLRGRKSVMGSTNYRLIEQSRRIKRREEWA